MHDGCMHGGAGPLPVDGSVAVFTRSSSKSPFSVFLMAGSNEHLRQHGVLGWGTSAFGWTGLVPGAVGCNKAEGGSTSLLPRACACSGVNSSPNIDGKNIAMMNIGHGHYLAWHIVSPWLGPNVCQGNMSCYTLDGLARMLVEPKKGP
jgi:hypothetical protein